MTLMIEDLDPAAWRREMLAPRPLDDRDAAVQRFLAGIPPQKRWDPRVRQWVEMIGTGPWDPGYVTAKLNAVNDAVLEAEREIFVDVNVVTPSVVWLYDRAVARVIGIEVPISTSATLRDEVIRLAGVHNAEVVIIDETGAGMVLFQELVNDAGYVTGRHRPWLVKPLRLLDQVAAARHR